MNSIMSAVMVVGGLGAICALVLVVASKIMEVKVDPRIEAVRDALPGANCGACGCAGCDDFAKAIVESGAEPARCIPGGAKTAQEVAGIMGIAVGEVKKKIAVLKCQGTESCTSDKFTYTGVETCKACVQLYGGKGSCSFGCLGFGDCTKMCEFGAMEIIDGIVHIYEDLCTGCGACTKVCPKALLEVITAKTTAVVQCKNENKGAVTKKACSTGCIGCRKCTKVCPSDAITVTGFLATVDYDKCTNCGACVAECPVNIISLK